MSKSGDGAAAHLAPGIREHLLLVRRTAPTSKLACMSSAPFEFLNDSILFDPTLIAEEFASVAEAELARELERYRAHVLLKLQDMTDDLRDGGALRLFAGADASSLVLLRQAAFYLDRVVLPDPLFRHTEVIGGVRRSLAEGAGLPFSKDFNRPAIAASARLMRDARPMVAAGLANFFPLSYFGERPEAVPLYHSPAQFDELLPSEVATFYRSAARVKALVKDASGGLAEVDSLDPCRQIVVSFGEERPGWAYKLFAPKTLSADQETRVVRWRMDFPDEPPSAEEFDAWVRQSVNQAARHHLDGLSMDIGMASACNAAYLTGSAFAAKVLGLTGTATQSRSIAETTARTVLDLRLPFFDQVSIADIVTARSDEDAFNLFRRELEKQCRELRLETDPERRKAKLDNAIHELTEVQRTKVDQAVKRLKKRLAADAVVAAGGLAATFATSGASLLATLVAAASAYRTVLDAEKSIKESPAYFLWKVNPRMG